MQAEEDSEASRLARARARAGLSCAVRLPETHSAIARRSPASFPSSKMIVTSAQAFQVSFRVVQIANGVAGRHAAHARIAYAGTH